MTPRTRGLSEPRGQVVQVSGASQDEPLLRFLHVPGHHRLRRLNSHLDDDFASQGIDQPWLPLWIAESLIERAGRELLASAGRMLPVQLRNLVRREVANPK